MTSYPLNRFEITTYKDKSSTDTAQVPVNATINFYRQGASVKTLTAVGLTVDPVPVPVFDVGAILIGDSLSVNGSTLPSLLVDSVDVANNILNVLLTVGSPITLNVTDRLTPVSLPRPVAYSDLFAVNSLGNSISTNTTSGRGSAYLGTRKVDYIVNIAGSSPRLYSDADGGHVFTAPAWRNVVDYNSVQAAVDSLPPIGGVVYIPAGQYSPASVPLFIPPLVLPFDRPVTILGDGVDKSILIYDVIHSNSQPIDNNLDLILVGGDSQTIQGLTLRGSAGLGSGTGRGIVLRRRGVNPITQSNQILYNSTIKDVLVQKCFGVGIDFDTSPRDGLGQFVVISTVENVEVRSCVGGGVHVGGNGSTTVHFKNLHVRDCAGLAISCQDTSSGPISVSFIDAVVETVSVSSSAKWIVLKDCQNVLFDHLYVEGHPPAQGVDPVDYYLSMTGNCFGISVRDSIFTRYGSANPIDVKIIRVGAGARNILISNPFVECDVIPTGTPIVIESNVNDITVIGGSLRPGTSAPIPIMISDDVVNRSTFVNVMSRVRLPRLSSSEIAALGSSSTIKGDIVFDTTANAVRVFDGSSWKYVSMTP